MRYRPTRPIQWRGCDERSPSRTAANTDSGAAEAEPDCPLEEPRADTAARCVDGSILVDRADIAPPNLTIMVCPSCELRSIGRVGRPVLVECL
jgi:hypothetical protein